MKKFIITSVSLIIISMPVFSMEIMQQVPDMYYPPEPHYYRQVETYEQPPVQTVTVRNKYDGINTTANVISAIANILTAIRVWTW